MPTLPLGILSETACAGGPIKVKGDGTPHRSYLYAADLAVWLWTILFRGESCAPYNVGSEHDLSIADLAEKVASCFPQPMRVHVAEKPVPGASVERYVPSVQRAFKDLGLSQMIPLEQAVRNTIAWQTAKEGNVGPAHGERSIRNVRTNTQATFCFRDGE